VDLLRKGLVGVTVVGLAIDAYIHIKLSGDLEGVRATVSEADLFRIEAVMAIVAAVLLLVRPNRLTAALAALVAGGGTFALLLYYFVDVGAIGPIPNMHEPVMYSDKVITLVAQTVATVTALALVVLGWPREGQSAGQVNERQSANVL